MLNDGVIRIENIDTPIADSIHTRRLVYHVVI